MVRLGAVDERFVQTVRRIEEVEESVKGVDRNALDEMAAGGRGQNLIPWPNRIEDGKLRPVAGAGPLIREILARAATG